MCETFLLCGRKHISSLLNDDMFLRLLLRRGKIITLWLSWMGFLLFFLSRLTFPPTNLISARPIHSVDAVKEFLNDPTHAQTQTGAVEIMYPHEIQKAVCTVTTGDVKATAEAVTTKELKGVCRSGEMSTAFSNLEQKLFNELESIKSILTSLSWKNNCYGNPNIKEPISTKLPVKFQPIPDDIKNLSNNIEISKHHRQQSQFLGQTNQTSPLPFRETGILIYNNTFLPENNFRVFTYHWKIDNFTEKIKSGDGITVESPAFSIKGKSFNIKASFTHLHRDFLFLQLEDATSHAKSGNSIHLETGGLFKQIENKSFKYKISVLHQNAQRKNDLVSQEFENYESGFFIPNSALLDSPFVKDDAVLIQITLFF